MARILFFVLIILALSCGDVKEEGQPNIVLFLVDDLGWQDTSVPFWTMKTAFNNRYQTPNMERLARAGMKFTNAYATSVCSPSRISLMTGMNAARHRVTNWTLHRDRIQPMETNHEQLDFPMWNVNGLSTHDSIPHAAVADPLPLILSNAGYRTIHVGKGHFGALNTPAADPRNIGFDINVGGHAPGAPKSYLGRDKFGYDPDFKGAFRAVPGLEKYHGQEIYLTEALTREALIHVDEAIGMEQPFFLYMSLYAVHTPIMADDRFVQTYYDMGIDSTEAKYASMVTAMDKSLGDILSFLEEKGKEDNTIVLFMSDNGGLSAVARGGERHRHNFPLSSGKGSIREGGIREPMIVKWPGKIKEGSASDQPIIIEDFYPSILEMAGLDNIDVRQAVDGISFVDLLLHKDISTTSKTLIWHYPNEWGPTGPGIGANSAIRKGDFKLIYYHASESFELFDLAKDIGETTNLVDQRQDLLKALAIELSDLLRSRNAQMPVHKVTGKQVHWPDEIL